jgi:EmrB/QacA subfamily drug resistance transporter
MVSTASPPVATHDHAHDRRWFTLAVLCMSLLIIVMDNTILNVAIPSLIRNLGATNTDLQWIVDSYTLVFAGLLLTAGSLGDRYGRKLALRIGLIVFATGSILSALAQSPHQLIATRAFMGIGGALIMPSTLSIITNVFRDPRERGRAIAIWAGFSGLAVAVGPLVGGFLLEHFSWSSVFWVNVPIAAAAIIGGHVFIPESRDPNPSRIDATGAALSIVGLGSLLFAIIEGPTRGWTDPLITGAFAVGAAGIAAFLLWEAHTDHPMLDLNFFRNPRFSAANVAITLTFFAMFGSLFLMTQYWQLVDGYSPLQAGVRLLPMALTMMVAAPLSARVVERLGSKVVVGGGLTIMSGALLMLSFIGVTTPYLTVIGIMCLMALGMGMVMAPATESVMGSLPREKAGVGSAVNDTTRQVGGALGVAVIGSVVTSAYANNIASAASRLGIVGPMVSFVQESLGNALGLAQQTGRPEIGTVAKGAFVDAFSAGLRIGAAVVVTAAVLVFAFLPARAHAPARASQYEGSFDVSPAPAD